MATSLQRIGLTGRNIQTPDVKRTLREQTAATEPDYQTNNSGTVTPAVAPSVEPIEPASGFNAPVNFTPNLQTVSLSDIKGPLMGAGLGFIQGLASPVPGGAIGGTLVGAYRGAMGKGVAEVAKLAKDKAYQLLGLDQRKFSYSPKEELGYGMSQIGAGSGGPTGASAGYAGKGATYGLGPVTSVGGENISSGTPSGQGVGAAAGAAGKGASYGLTPVTVDSGWFGDDDNEGVDDTSGVTGSIGDFGGDSMGHESGIGIA